MNINDIYVVTEYVSNVIRKTLMNLGYHVKSLIDTRW